MAAILLALCVSLYGKDADSLQWRSPTNGEINVLYCYLNVLGYKYAYIDLLAEQEKVLGTGTHTANTVVRVAKQFGVRLQVASLTMNELKSAGMPLILHMDGATPEAGAFILAMKVTDKQIYYVNGSTASIQVIPTQDFQRNWSGIALMLTVSKAHELELFGSGIFLGAFAIYLLRRSGKPIGNHGA